MVFRVYVEKKKEFAVDARNLAKEVSGFLKVKGITSVKIVNRYDVEGVSEDIFKKSVTDVFSESLVDSVSFTIPNGDFVFAVEALPGQYDQAADSAAECIKLFNNGIRPVVQTAKVYCLDGEVTRDELNTIKKYLINSVENRETSLDLNETLAINYDPPEEIFTLTGFIGLDINGLKDFLDEYFLAMDIDDLALTQSYFIEIGRDPTITEIRVLDTYWSDHCRHTTFFTELAETNIESDIIKKSFERYLSLKEQLGRGNRPTTLMDIAQSSMRYLKSIGKLNKLDESKEVNACTVKTKVNVDGLDEDWLFYFKNETHNHPTEIEPFGGAATCTGGGIRDPLSGRSFVYQAMRLSAAGDVTKPYSETLKGKLPQRYITKTAAAGNSSYSNAAGLTAGYLDEIYHPNYVAKRMELGALVAAAKAENVVRKEPVEGDLVLLLGDRTGRDGIGGATGSSRTQTAEAFEVCSAEVQKGDAVIGRKIHRLFRNPNVAKLIIRCNDFGAGGVSVAIGELADGLSIDLDAVKTKYPGLSGTEVAISEAQERMAIVIHEKSFDSFKAFADEENIDVYIVARVTKEPKMVMYWKGEKIVELDRKFLDMNGAPKKTKVEVKEYELIEDAKDIGFEEGYTSLLSSLPNSSKQAIASRFGSTINSGTLLLPYGGKYQATPIQSMAARFPVLNGKTSTASLMAYGFNPYLSTCNPYMGAYLAVNESVSKLVAAGALGDEMYLSFQEFFESLGDAPSRWGKPFAALLGALDAQLDYSLASIGGKDSMSGSYEGIDVPPTLISFAVSIVDEKRLITPEFKKANSNVALLAPEYDKKTGLPTKESQLFVWNTLKELIEGRKVISAYATNYSGIADAVYRMTLGNRIGFKFNDSFDIKTIFSPLYGAFVLELADDVSCGEALGVTSEVFSLCSKDSCLDLVQLQKLNEGVLADIFPVGHSNEEIDVVIPTVVSAKDYPTINFSASKPKALIPVFPGTNGEYDLAKAAKDADFDTEIYVVKTLTAEMLSSSFKEFSDKVKASNMLLIPSGVSVGAEPDGAAKFITLFLMNPLVRESIEYLLEEKKGLVYGVGEGFKALLNTGLLPYGRYCNSKKISLAKNQSGFYMDRMVRTKIVSDKSIWLADYAVGEVEINPFSTYEGQIVMDDETLKELIANGQIASTFTDFDGNMTLDSTYNPGGSYGAIEGISSPDGRVFGRICNSERNMKGLYLNMPGVSDKSIFNGARKYFI